MSEHLDKAKAAIGDAKKMEVDLDSETLPRRYNRLLSIAQIQAEIAQAEALEVLVRVTAHGTKFDLDWLD